MEVNFVKSLSVVLKDLKLLHSFYLILTKKVTDVKNASKLKKNNHFQHSKSTKGCLKIQGPTSQGFPTELLRKENLQRKMKS